MADDDDDSFDVADLCEDRDSAITADQFKFLQEATVFSAMLSVLGASFIIVVCASNRARLPARAAIPVAAF